MPNEELNELDEFKKVHDEFISVLSSIKPTDRLQLSYKCSNDKSLTVRVRETYSSVSINWYDTISFYNIEDLTEDTELTTHCPASIKFKKIVLMDRNKIQLMHFDDKIFYLKDLDDDGLFNYRILLTDEEIFCIECAMRINIPEEYNMCIIDMDAFDYYIYMKLMELQYG